MKTNGTSSLPDTKIASRINRNYFRFHLPYLHLSSLFGDDWVALKAEAFARFFGTPFFLVAQTFVVAIWITASPPFPSHCASCVECSSVIKSFSSTTTLVAISTCGSKVRRLLPAMPRSPLVSVQTDRNWH